MDSRTAIILVGGGMKSAHGAGFLYTLATKLDMKSPDILIASSGDAGNLAYFCAGQYESLPKIWTELLSTPKFISLARFWKIINVDYLIDEVFKKQEPLSVDRLLHSEIEWNIPVVDFENGAVRYVGKEDDVNIFETLRASKAIPLFYGKKVRLQKDRYIDGEFGTILEDHVCRALSLGADRIVIINHVAPWTSSNKLFARLYALLAPAGTKEAILRDISNDITHFDAPRAKVIFINPQKLPVGTATRNQQKLKNAFERGVADALKLRDELKILFQTNAPSRIEDSLHVPELV